MRELALYIQANALSILMLGGVYVALRPTASDSMDDRLFCWLLNGLMAVLVADSVTVALDGAQFWGAYLLGNLSNIIYFLLSVALAALWYAYVSYRVHGSLERLLRHRILFFAPLVLVAVLAAISPWTGALFYLDSGNAYCRGALFWLQAVITLGYLLLASVWALAQARRELARSKKSDYRMLAWFAPLLVLGSLGKIAIYDLPLLWPVASVSLLWLFMNRQNRQIAVDPLTGVNNRGRMERYLALQSEAESEDLLCMVLIDVNDFKQINDTYGHAAGDLALLRLAEVLKRVLGAHKGHSGNDFLARYGGDEFVILGRRHESCQMDELLAEIQQELARDNARHHVQGQPQLSVSMGYGAIAKGGNVQDLMDQADEQMYQAKRRYHGQPDKPEKSEKPQTKQK